MCRGRSIDLTLGVLFRAPLAQRARTGLAAALLAVALGPMLAFGGAVALAQGAAEAPGAAAPGSDAAVARGAGLYRERCAECHGADAKGVPGHDLTRLWATDAADARVFQTIRTGVPNTAMPSSAASDDEIRALVGYLRSLNGAASAEVGTGNAENGERIFWTSCGSCHAVNGRGGRLGPDLSRIAQSREQLTQAIRSPSTSLAAGYQPVTLVTRAGARVRGAKKGEDAFSIQIMDTNQRLQGFLKSSLRDVVRETSSLMPAFGPERLSERDLDDLLRFLGTLRPAASGRR